MQTSNLDLAPLKKMTSSFLNMEERLIHYDSEVKRELKNILDYWIRFTPDEVNGGFVGKVDHQNHIQTSSLKGSVLNSRILWSFSAAYNVTGDQQYLGFANRAFDYLTGYFIDKEFGGIYWTVDHLGNPLDTKKQIYAQAFAVYALSEFHTATRNNLAKEQAIELYRDIIKHSYDKANGGYVEALSRDWKESTELRLSAKDENEPKSMNTHLHLLEAFSNLYSIFPTEQLKNEIKELINLFLVHFISKHTHHLVLFFDNRWNEKSSLVSYGHDIEAAWLIQEAAEIINDKMLVQQVKNSSLLLAQAAAKGLDADGGLWYEYDPQAGRLIKEKHWWPQAEAMVGFFNAWEIAGNDKFLQRSIKSWEFIQEHIVDKQNGEWRWGIKEDYSPMDYEDKVGIWKCPYHNSRACMQIMKRIAALNLR